MTAPTTERAATGDTAADTLLVSGIGVVRPPAEPDGEWFDHRAELGAQGYKYVPRASQYLLAAARRALADGGLPATGGDDGCGVALGSNNCASQLHAEIDRQVRETGIRFLRPANAPFFSVNLFLARLGIEHGWRGFSLALHSPRVAGLEAVEWGERAVRRGRARWLVVGATESTLDSAESGADASEDGAVVLTLEPADRLAGRSGGRALGTLRAGSLFVPPASATRGGALAERLGRIAADLGLDAGTRVTLVAEESTVAEAVSDALSPAETVVAGPGCLSPLLAAADALRAGTGPRLIATASATGNVAVAAVRPATTTQTEEGAR